MEQKRQTVRCRLGIAFAILAICAAVSLVACNAGNDAAQASAAPTGAAFNPPDEVALPIVDASDLEIDTSHASDGYVVAHASSSTRLKLQVSKGDTTYNYDLQNNGTPEVFPVNMGDGNYLFRVMKNTDGNNYVELTHAEADIALSSEFAPFLIPNQFCDYSATSACVAKARELTAGVENQGEAVKAVCEYIVANVAYDTGKARELSASTGYVPDPDSTLASGAGVCFDYASLGAAMLRSQGIPTKIVTGYVSPGDLYHAWIMVYIDGSWHTAKFSVNPDTWSRVDLTFAASGSTEFTGDGANYTDRYVY